MKTKYIVLIIFSILPTLCNAQLFGKKNVVTVSEDEYTIDAQKNIVVTKIVEGLNLNSGDILAISRKYLVEAYKETKYSIVQDNEEKGVVIGQGRYDNFLTMNLFPNAYYLCADFYLRVDAKEGRARISLYANSYGGQRENGNITEEISDKIAEFQPINKESSENKKLYSKAFPILIGRMQDTLADIEETLKQAVSMGNENTDW